MERSWLSKLGAPHDWRAGVTPPSSASPAMQVYPKYSEALPTDDQTIQAISKMRVATQPAPSCCAGLRPLLGADCICNP